jgi:hypothetical protein
VLAGWAGTSPVALWRIALWAPWLSALRESVEVSEARRWAIARGVPRWIIELVDRMRWHGELFRRELGLRREAALLRGALTGPHRLRVWAWSAVLERAVGWACCVKILTHTLWRRRRWRMWSGGWRRAWRWRRRAGGWSGWGLGKRRSGDRSSA